MFIADNMALNSFVGKPIKFEGGTSSIQVYEDARCHQPIEGGIIMQIEPCQMKQIICRWVSSHDIGAERFQWRKTAM